MQGIPLRRWRTGLAGACALLLVVVVALPVGLAPMVAAPAGSATGVTGPSRSPADQPTAPLTLGSFELAKVRILGIPAITVAAPVVGLQGNAPDAQRRAEVIEGNLRRLYAPVSPCSGSEWIAEWILLQVLGGRERACAPSITALSGGAPDGLVVRRRELAAGDVVLEALLPERGEPIPLLTVTYADAALNGTSAWELAGRWQERLQSRLRHARQVSQPAALHRRWQIILGLELVLLITTGASFLLWRRNRRDREAWLVARREGVGRRLETHSQLHRFFGLVLLLLVLLQLMVMIALAVMAVPGEVPLGLELILQPILAALKLMAMGLIALAGRSLVTFLLHQWADSARVPAEEQARREQRRRSLLRVSHRLIDLASLLLAVGWILVDIPSVRSSSSSVLVAGGALLGGLALVFQGLLRDFAAGMAVLLEDRYAIGDWVEIGGLEGDVVDVGVLSTQLRCLDQRVAVVQNSAFDRVVNHTKLRSGILVNLVVSHRCHDIDRALAVVAGELNAFHSDSSWSSRLLAAPLLRGVSATGPLGITVSILLTTVAGEQWACSRELRRRLVARFQREAIPLADGLELAGTAPLR
jgi:small conductance mechanosensitive channel